MIEKIRIQIDKNNERLSIYDFAVKYFESIGKSKIEAIEMANTYFKAWLPLFEGYNNVDRT
ncbi:MAG: hypothetical protein PHC28_05935 [Flavobacterium sp.]|uniref:hypothetical protein n=1 Tax=Flavobacterium sp. TaxID=239 RepID=UPI002629AED3|nr:hypothetical protein [Flavobacterium sp.]MDD5150009.1 hypothetical protein [Flavobacterium sp.]